MSFLTTEQLRVRYGGATVLHELDLHAERGSLVALLGASGSGKTTLLRAIAGFNPVSAGRVMLDRQDITAQPPERRRMAMVFQSYALWPHMTVAQNIGYGLRLRRVPRAAVAAKVAFMLDMLHLQVSVSEDDFSDDQKTPAASCWQGSFQVTGTTGR